MNTKNEAVGSGHLMAPPAAAEYLGGIVVGTLAKWRHYGQGPAFVRIGSRIMYERQALDAYIAARRCRSTSEAI
jgi:hypothetical protein